MVKVFFFFNAYPESLGKGIENYLLSNKKYFKNVYIYIHAYIHIYIFRLSLLVCVQNVKFGLRLPGHEDRERNDTVISQSSLRAVYVYLCILV